MQQPLVKKNLMTLEQAGVGLKGVRPAFLFLADSGSCMIVVGRRVRLCEHDYSGLLLVLCRLHHASFVSVQLWCNTHTSVYGEITWLDDLSRDEGLNRFFVLGQGQF